MATVSLLQLLHIADSALPVGTAAHSFGLESLIGENGLNVSALGDFFPQYLREGGQLEASFVIAGYEAEGQQQWREWNELLSAMKPARETREASLRLGKRLAKLAFEAFDIPAPFCFDECHSAMVFGYIGRCIGSSPEEVAACYLHQSMLGMVSACQRLLPLGQVQAARLLWQLKPAILDSVRRARASALSDACLCQPLMDIASARHPHLFSRLFIS